MNTSIAKTKTGWQGNTRIELDGGRVLCIVTMKDDRGGLETSADVRRVTRLQSHVVETFSRYDYRKRMLWWNVRVTEKQVRAQHSQALDMVDEMVFDIDQHYAVDKG